MAKNESVEFFLRFLKERFNEFRHSLNEFLRVIALEDRNTKVAAATKVLGAIDDLKRAIAKRDHPSWIAPLEESIMNYSKHAPRGTDIGLHTLQSIISLTPAIDGQRWNFTDDNATTAIDFNAIFDEFYSQSRIPELFEELVLQLEQIIETGEIDSVHMIKALEKLISTIRRNSKSDLFSIKGSWEFSQLFLKNVAIDVLEEIPGLKHIVKGIRKTMSELDLEMSQLHDRISEKLIASARTELPMLEYRQIGLPAPKDIDQNSSQHKLPSIKEDKLTN